MFNGDISKFSPADLLLFLAHLNKEGVLTVSRNGECLCFSFRGGVLIDAQSEAADDRILRILRHRDLISDDILDYIGRARQETNVPLVQVMESLEWLSIQKLRDILALGIPEALLQLFLWESGNFKFAEISVEQGPLQNTYDIQNLVMEITRQVDEYRDILKVFRSLDFSPVVTTQGQGDDGSGSAVDYVLTQATGSNTLRQILAAAPHTSYDTIKAMAKAHSEGLIQLAQEELKKPDSGGRAASAECFQAYKRSLKKMLQAKDIADVMTEFVGYCGSQFEYTLVIVAKDEIIARGTKFARGPDGRIERTRIQGNNTPLSLDSTFYWVHQTELPFFGTTLPSDLFRALGEKPPPGECAVIPLGQINGLIVLVYVVSAVEIHSPGSLQYLELLSWHMHTPPDDAQRAALEASLPANGARSEPPSCDDAIALTPDRISDVVAAMKDLPPMPGVAARILDLISDTNCKMSSLTEALSQDQALVARLIKVSNSTLYGGGKKTSNLNQALVRLGTRNLRSLVIAASTRSLFPTDQTNIGLWGQSLWQHSIGCGLASRRIAKAIQYADPEEAFVGGVLHDIGKVVLLLKMPDLYRRIRNEQAYGKGDPLEVEKNILQTDHTLIGEMLLQQWNVPESLIICARFHHNPSEAEEFGTLADIVAFGDYLDHTCGSLSEAANPERSRIIQDIADRLSLSGDRLHDLEQTIDEDMQHSAVFS